jgi:LysR family transcriptional regulator, regulator for metE and metH
MLNSVQVGKSALAWHLDTRTLRMLIAVAETASAVQAAARLNISASALSHQMKKAEADLRVTLFDRRGARIRLSATGEQLCVASRRIVSELEVAEDILERTRRGASGAVRVGGGPYPVHRLLIGKLSPHELCQINVMSRIKTFPLGRAVLEGELDLAFVGAGVAERGLVVTPLFRDDLVAVVARTHPLADMPCLAGQDYASHVYISYSRVVEDGLEDALLFRPTHAAPRHFMQAETTEAILDLVEAGLGFGILSRWSIPASRSALRIIPLLAGGASVVWSMIRRESERDANVIALEHRVLSLFGPPG